MPSVTVALLGTRDGAFTDKALFDKKDRAKKWDERESVELEVADDEPLSSILHRAGEALDVEGPGPNGPVRAPVPTFVGFYDAEAENEVGEWGAAITLVDEQGRARWNVPYESVAYDDLVRAIEAKAVAGDPRRLYYVTYPGIGNGIVITLLGIAAGLRAVYDVMQIAATIEDNISLVQRVRDAVRQRLERGSRVIEIKAPEWEQRGGDATSLGGIVRFRVWNTADLAPLLDCTEEEAADLLAVIGYSKDELGLWRLGADEEARLAEMFQDEINLSYSLGHEDFEKTLTKRTQYLLATGERAPRPFMDGVDFGDEAQMKRYDAEAEEEELRPEDVARDDDLDPEGRYGSDGGLDERVPLEQLMLKCACGKHDCRAIAEFGIANGRLKIGFTGPTDHFVVDADYMETIASQIVEEIEEAKDPNGDG